MNVINVHGEKVKIKEYQVSFADEGELRPFSAWYSIFSMSEPVILHKGG